MKTIKMGVLLIGLLAMGQTAAQELLCPETGIPMSQDPGCVIPNYNNSPSPAQQQLPPQPTGFWKTMWGAIAADGPRGILGAVTDMEDKSAAERAALSQCSKNGGQGCKVELSYYNQCAVLVTGNKKYLVQSAATIPEATNLGIKKCSQGDVNCRVYYSGCSQPQFVNY